MKRSYTLTYPNLWREHWWWRSRWRFILQEVKDLAATRSKGEERPSILDIGCAGGLGFDDLSKSGDVYGLEPDAGLAESVPKWRHRVTVRPFDSTYDCEQQYDLVLMLDVLEHLEDDVGAIRTLHKILKPGGTALLTVPALQSLWSAHDIVNEHYRRSVCIAHRAAWKPVVLHGERFR